MANIIARHSLVEFKNANGKLNLAPCKNGTTQETFTCLAFTQEGKDTIFVAFSKNLGPLNAQQIKEMKDDLQVVTNDEGYHTLCKRGANQWEEIDL